MSVRIKQVRLGVNVIILDGERYVRGSGDSLRAQIWKAVYLHFYGGYLPWPGDKVRRAEFEQVLARLRRPR